MSKDTYYRSILIRPIVTEKSSLLGGLVLEVSKVSTKIDIKEAVEHVFKVKVRSVNVTNIKGKVARVGKSVGFRKNIKKAYVYLAEGESFSLFEGL
jgi:large subunit ribosomal protein L23